MLGGEFFENDITAENQTEYPGDQPDPPVQKSVSAGSEIHGQADQNTHRHHTADRSDAENYNIEQRERRRGDYGQDQQHQGRASGKAVHKTDQDRPRAETMVRRFRGVRVRMNVNMLALAVLVCVHVNGF